HCPKPDSERVVNFRTSLLEHLLQESDFVTLHTPSADDTYHLISDRQFELMKQSAILINTARGTIVDPDSLYRALANGKIAGAAVDVTEPEPLPSDSPLLTLDNLI
ncbi:MAG: NAD(P)-dependent oxidoreductase, partial [Nostoc sp.]